MTDDPIRWRKVGREATKGRPDKVLGVRRRPKPAAPSAPPLSVAARVRIARGTPQAVVKVLSYRRGLDAVRSTAAYVVGKAGHRFVVEGDIEVSGQDARNGMVRDWSRDFSGRKNGRDVVHMEMSAPPGADRDKLFAAARSFVATTFGPNHQYALAEHRDTKHPHCHLLVKLRGHDGRQLDPRKRDLSQWREAFAAAARAQGLDLDASPRAARGVARKSQSRVMVALRRRGRMLDVDRAEKAPPGAVDAFLRARGERLAQERDAYRIAALRLERSAKAAPSPDEQARLRDMARDVFAFGERLPQLTPPTPGQDRARAPGSAPSRSPDFER
jgi:hypothetical protein